MGKIILTETADRSAIWDIMSDRSGVGSLHQASMMRFIMIADAQALTDNADNPENQTEHLEVATDYLAVGLILNRQQF